jgi:hypothetical protein
MERISWAYDFLVVVGLLAAVGQARRCRVRRCF